MPTYEYVCEKCRHTFETSQSILDQALTVCPKALCGQKKWGRGKVKRAISVGGGLLFKGNGFYTTDYRSEGYKKSAKSDSATPAVTPAATPATTPVATPTPMPAASGTGGGKSDTPSPATPPAKTKADKP
jgi:putative FmdB family regulatory protein